MIDGLKGTFKDWIPPGLLKTYRRIQKYGFSGDYSSWQEVQQVITGYDAINILEKVKLASLEVRAGKAAYERDSVIFEKVYYSFPVLAGLLRVAVENQGNLSVLDFGGSLGSSYYQCRDFLSNLKELKWNIVEQKHFVECGKQFFEDDCLKFFYSIEDCLNSETPDVIFLSSVVQYLEHPYQFLQQLVHYNFKHIIFDRTTFLETGSDRLTVQTIPPEIYSASYPAWFLNRESFLDCFQIKYQMIAEFEALAGKIEIKNPHGIAQDLGFIFEMKGNS